MACIEIVEMLWCREGLVFGNEMRIQALGCANNCAASRPKIFPIATSIPRGIRHTKRRSGGITGSRKIREP